MKAQLLIVAALLMTAGCDLDFSINCQVVGGPKGGSWYCSDPVDAGTDGGMDAAVADAGQPVVDAGKVDAGQPAVVDAGQPVVDAGQPPAPSGVFRVVGNKLYDPNGAEFRMRGNNRTHIDNHHPPANLFKSNTSRWVAYFIDDPDRTVRDVTGKHNGGSTAHGSVAVIGDWAQTCADNDAVFEQIVARWVKNAAKYQAIANVSIVNIANEYSPSSDEKWRDKYIDAVKRIRAAGYKGNIQIDARGCGQQASPIIRYGKDVLAADPEKNLHFSVHTYGLFYSVKHGQPKSWSEQQDVVPTFDALAATGLHIVLGEVGPGPLLGGGLGGPSPTKISATAFVNEAEARGFGWLLWSSDDNTEANARCNNDSFCMTYDTTLNALGSNLTDWGKEAVGLWDRYAVRATTF